MLTDMKDDGMVLVLRSVEMLLRVLPAEGATLMQPLIPGMIKIIMDGEQYQMIMSMYLSLIARLVLYAEPIFTWAINQVSVIYCRCNCFAV